MGGFGLTVIGLTLSSSWGNGHATTYRALLRALAGRGAAITFLERDVPWYAQNRDLPCPDYATLELYDDLQDLRSRFLATVRNSDAVIVGSYVPDGVEVIDWVLETARGPVLFYDIDTPVTLERLGHGNEDYIAERQVPLFDAYLSFSGGPVLDRLRILYGAKRPQALYCAVDTERYRPPRRRREVWQLGYLGTYSADRQPALDSLLGETARRMPQDRFVVAGPQYPDNVTWPANVERIPHLPPDAHPGFYGDQAFTLNLTRAAMAAIGWSPSVRLFEAAACGTPIISDCWAGLEAFFPAGEAILIADSHEDVRDYLAMSEAERSATAEAAREIVCAHHCAEARAAQLEEFLEEVQQTRESVA